MSEDEELEKWVEKILSKYRKKVGTALFPINERIIIDAIEENEGIEIELKEKKTVFVGRDEGILVPKRGGFILQYGLESIKGRKKLFNPIARKRFTICHELAHIFFYDCSYAIPKMIRKPPEHICDSITRRLLLPKELLINEFSNRYQPKAAIIPFLRELARDAEVSLYPLIKRLIEDLSLIENAMITLWTYKLESNLEPAQKIQYENYKKDSKTSPKLRSILPKYWRNKVHLMVWKTVVKEVVTTGKIPSLENKLHLLGKRSKKGKKKRLSFEVECVTLQTQTPLKSKRKMYNVLTIEKFDFPLLK